MNLLPIPQCNPGLSYLEHAAEIDATISAVLHGGHYILGDQVASFELEFARYCEVRSGLGVGNGTDALEIALRAVGVAAGSVVITVSHTAVATVAAIRRCGANPLFVDVNFSDGLLDPDQLDQVLEQAERGLLGFDHAQIKAIVPVHLYGRCADMPRILASANRNGIAVVEDCAQAHGARISDRRAGSWGVAGAFSFYPTKNLGAFGDAGAIVTSDAGVSERCRLLRQYGWKHRYVSDVEGGNSRLDELQAAILRVKLSHLDDDNGRRAAIARRYRAAIADTGLEGPEPDELHEDVFHQFVVRSGKRDQFQSWLAGRGIGTLIHYPVPVHLQPAYLGRVHVAPAGLAVTERLAAAILSLPMFPQLTEAQVDRVCAELEQWHENAEYP